MLTDACAKAGITIESDHRGQDGEMDRWDCRLRYQGKVQTFEFRTGFGHRKLSPGWKAEGLAKWYHNVVGTVRGYAQAIAAGALRPVPPGAADVVSCVLSDLEAVSSSFEEWCDNYGENSDSRKVLATYHACQQNGDKLRKLLPSDLIETLRKEEH